jgi:AcrR family transcriptional regulator
MNAARNTAVLDAACTIAHEEGVAKVTRMRVADAAGVSLGSVSAAFGGMPELHEAVMREAVRRPLLSVLAQGLAMGDAIARDAPDDLKRQAVESAL